MQIARDVKERLVKLLLIKHHDTDTTLRNLSRLLDAPYSTVRDAVRSLEAEGVVKVIRLEREHIVKLKNLSMALEKGYLDEDFVMKHFGFITPLVARKNGIYLSDELYITLPYMVKRHEAFTRLIELDLKTREFMDPHLAKLGEWPRLNLLFYRVVLVPEDDIRRRWIQENGLESLGYYEPAYGFFAFLLYALRKAAGLSWEEAYCKTFQLIKDYIQETRRRHNIVEKLVDEIIEGVGKMCNSQNTPSRQDTPTAQNPATP